MRWALGVFAIIGFSLIGQSVMAGEKGDLKKLQGKWKIVKTVVGGKEFPKILKASILVKDDTFTLLAGEKQKNPTKVRLDGSKKPAQVDFIHPENGKVTGKGIYRIKENQVTFCWEGSGPKEVGKRPTEFESPEGSRIRLLVLERIGDKKE